MRHHLLRGHKSKSVNHKIVKSRVCLLKFKWAKGSAFCNATFDRKRTVLEWRFYYLIYITTIPYGQK